MNEPIYVVVDSSRSKVNGEHQWKVRQYGRLIRRTWHKLHLGINEATGEVVAETLTKNSGDNAAQAEPLLEQIDPDVETLSGDDGYDKLKVFQALADPPQKKQIKPIIALLKDATIQRHGNT